MRTLGLLMLLAALQESSTPLHLGDERVQLVSHANGAGPLLVNVHDDENTAVEAAREVIARRGGKLLELQHAGTRLITFSLHGKPYSVDPNRIFTPAGIPASLRRYGPSSPEAVQAVTAFASALLEVLQPPRGFPLIAVHNNTRALDYSITSYQPGGSDAGEAAEVALGSGADPNDFFLVTERAHFEALKKKGFNVALQKPVPATDDGSLSVYCAQKHLAYINVEAEHGHRAAQVKMLDALYDLLAPAQSP